MKLFAHKEQILKNIYGLSLQDMGLLWLIMFLVDDRGEFEISFDELQQKFNYKNKSALNKAIKKLIEYRWIEKISKNIYRTTCFKVK